MDSSVAHIFRQCGIEIDDETYIKEQIVERDILLSKQVYQTVKPYIPKIKQQLSSSSLSSLQVNAQSVQQWPLLNLVRQLLRVYRYTLVPVRKSNGYDRNGKKKYKRSFLIKKCQ